MKQLYATLIFLILFSVAGSASCVYFSIGYNEISSYSKNEEIESKINTEDDINSVKEMAHYMHTSYKTALKEHGETYATIAKILAAISIICGLALFSTYKYTISKNV